MKIEKKVAPAFEEFIFDWDYCNRRSKIDRERQ
jgi:hypothetical protein